MSKSKYSNDFKREVLLNGIDKQVAKTSHKLYKDSCEWFLTDEDTGEVSFDMVNGLYCDFIDYCKEVPSLDCALRLNESKYRKAKKVREKIGALVMSDNAVFLTLTFKDSVFAKTSAETRRRYVARYLKRYATNYAANIDFGEDDRYTHREHYHAVVDSDVDFSPWYKYGGIKAERIHRQSKRVGKTLKDDLAATSKYITKLSNHALKVKGLVPRLIYSRNTL